VERLVDAALDAAFRDGTVSFGRPPVMGSPVSAVVKSVVSPTQVLVDVEGRSQALMRTHLLATGLSAEIKAGVDEDLTALATEGDVVTVEVIRVENEFVAEFSAEEPAPALSYLPGGPPWVVPRPETIDEAHNVLVDQPATAEQSTTGFAQVAALEQELESLEQRHLRDQVIIRRLQRALRLNRKFSIPVVHSDPERQLRLELELDYLSRVEESDRPKFPWPERYHIGSGFIESLDRLVRNGGITREKVVEVCADVLCGRAKEMSSRALKEWRISRQGPQLKRDSDGASAWRVRLQTGASAARRLRYWLLRNGEIELDRVSVHDEGLEM
jgi:hypothetical protein